jgi:hypothetical protein
LALQNDKDIMVLPADKVVLLSEEYYNKIKAVFNDPVCTKLTMDPIYRVERQTASVIKKLNIP